MVHRRSKYQNSSQTKNQLSTLKTWMISISVRKFWKNTNQEDTNIALEKNYREYEQIYDFSGLSFPTRFTDINLSVNEIPDVSVNVYGLEKVYQQIQKYPTYEVYPLKAVDKENDKHFNLLLLNKDEKYHFTYIAYYSRLVLSQKTLYNKSEIFCKRCFTSFNIQPMKMELCVYAAFDENKLICGLHKPILPEMPIEGDMVELKSGLKC